MNQIFWSISYSSSSNVTRLLIISFPVQNLRAGLEPNIKRMQNLAKPSTLHVSESGVGLLHNNSEYEMGNLRRDDSFNM